MTPGSHGEIISVFIGGLNFAEGMAEGVFAEVAQEGVPITDEVWRTKVKRIRGSAGNPERRIHIGRTRQWPKSVGIDSQPIDSGLIYFGGTDRPGIMKSNGLRLHGFHEFLNRLDIIISNVFPRPGIS